MTDQEINECVCRTTICCSLCGMMSCNCGPGDPCKTNMKCMAHRPKPGEVRDYGKAIVLCMLFIFCQEFGSVRQCVEDGRPMSELYWWVA